MFYSSDVYQDDRNWFSSISKKSFVSSMGDSKNGGYKVGVSIKSGVGSFKTSGLVVIINAD